MSSSNFSRRNFLYGAAALGVTGAVGSGVVSSCTPAENTNSLYSYKKRELNLPPLLEKAPDGIELKAGLIGCGGRGTEAEINFLDAGTGLKKTESWFDRLRWSWNRSCN